MTTSRPGEPKQSARDALVESAVTLFYEKGYSETSVQDIVEGADVTKGSFYHHFEAKEDLLLLIHDTFMDNQLVAIESIQASTARPRDQLSELIVHLIIGAGEFQREQTIFFESRRFLSEKKFSDIRRKRDRFELALVRIVDAGIAEGEFAATASSQIVAFGIVGMSAWAYQWYRRGSLSPQQVGAIYAGMIIDGLAPRA